MGPKRRKGKEKGSKETHAARAPVNEAAPNPYTPERRAETTHSANSVTDETETAPESANHDEPRPTKKTRVNTDFTDIQKEKIMEWLQNNPCIYTKQMSDYKNTEKKDQLWTGLAGQMESTVEKLEVFYKSIRTKLGRLKKRVKYEMSPDDMTPTDYYYWEKLQFLVPHIQDVKSKNVVSLKDAIAQTVCPGPSATEPAPVVLVAPSAIDSYDSESLVPSQMTTSMSTVSSSATELDSMVLHSLLQDFLTKKGTTSHFGSYVESRLRMLGPSQRREAEMKIMQVLNEVEERGERRSETLFQ